MRINTFCKLLQNEVGKILLSGFISERIFLKWTTFWCFQAVISERIFKKTLLYLENYMSCMIWFHKCHDPVSILQASVEDTPETAGKFAKKLPAFRNTLIEAGSNANVRSYEWKPNHAACIWKVTDNKEVPKKQKVITHCKEVVLKNLKERGSVPWERNWNMQRK